MYIVPKKYILDASKDPEIDQKNNTFIYALQIAKIYKNENLTPVFIYNPSENQLIVTTKQKINNEFH